MYSYFSGKIAEISNNSIVVDIGGIGYELFVSANTINSCKPIGESINLFAYLCVKEDEMSLYGFSSKSEKAMFLNLISISGIGPKLALGILGGMTLKDLAINIVSGNSSALNGIKGVGKKTSERIIIELKDKISDNFDEEIIVLPKESELNSLGEEAAMVLVALGYTKENAYKAVSAIYKDGMNVNQLVHKAISG